MDGMTLIDVISWNRLVFDKLDLRLFVLLLCVFNPNLGKCTIKGEKTILTLVQL